MLIMIITSCCIATLALFLSAGSGPGKSADPASSSRFYGWRAFAPWPAVIASLFIIPGDYLFRYYNMGEAMHDRTSVIDYAHEGIEGITTVHHFTSGHRVISTGSINVAGTAYTLRTTQKLDRKSVV